jgi:aldose 1-epimerase
LTPNFPPEPQHAIHGVGWQREWRVAKQTATELALKLQHDPDAQWPFHFAARQHFKLTADGLTVSLELSNTGTRAIPAGLGFHPFFPRSEATTFETTWTGVWTMSDRKVPIEHRAIPPEADFSKSRALGAWRVDSCFTGWSRKALLGYPTHRTEITATAGLNHCVTFIPVDGRPFIAVEPVSHIVDAFNLAAQGRKDTGMRVLKPGESWVESMTIRVMEGAS